MLEGTLVMGALTTVQWTVAAVVVSVLLGALGVQSVRLSRAQVEIAQLETAAAKEGERTARAVTAAVQVERDKEDARRRALEGVIEDAERQRKVDQVAAADARTERDRLRMQVTAFVAASRATRSDPKAPTPSASAGGEATDLLAELFNRADDRAGALAEIADDWHTRLVACNRAYDALTPSVAGVRVPGDVLVLQPRNRAEHLVNVVVEVGPGRDAQTFADEADTDERLQLAGFSHIEQIAQVRN